jgi:prolipoprotein diacylglyceryltransferase
MGLAALSPEFYRNTIRQVPDNLKQMLAYAWVGGSIWGGILGSLIGLTLGVVSVRTSWKKENEK